MNSNVVRLVPFLLVFSTSLALAQELSQGTDSLETGMPSENVIYKSWDVPGSPGAVDFDSKGNLWFRLWGGGPGDIAHLDLATDKLTRYEVPAHIPDRPNVCRVDRNDIVWCTSLGFGPSGLPGGGARADITLGLGENAMNIAGGRSLNGNGVIRFDPKDESWRVYKVPTAASGPDRSDFDSDGNLWFTEIIGNNIAKLDLETGMVSEYAVPSWTIPEAPGNKQTGTTYPYGLIVDPFDNVWFAQNRGYKIGKFDPVTETFTEHVPPTGLNGTRNVDADAEGNIWFTMSYKRSIGKIDARTGIITEYPVPGSDSYPYHIRIDDEKGSIWFWDRAYSYMVAFDPQTEKFLAYRAPWMEHQTTSQHLRIDKQGRVFFHDIAHKKIGMIQIPAGE